MDKNLINDYLKTHTNDNWLDQVYDQWKVDGFNKDRVVSSVKKWIENKRKEMMVDYYKGLETIERFEKSIKSHQYSNEIKKKRLGELKTFYDENFLLLEEILKDYISVKREELIKKRKDKIKQL